MSEKRTWSNTVIDIKTENAVGSGRENTKKILESHASDDYTNNVAKYCQSISPNSYLPSVAECYWIYNAISNKKITNIPNMATRKKRSFRFCRESCFILDIYSSNGKKKNKRTQ